jgi:Leucine-rich repeat (LRR) protein
LEVLHLENNFLDQLPLDFNKLIKLRCLFLANNMFTTVPTVIGSMESLFMLSFKSNSLESLPGESLHPNIAWLILTDNKLATLPAEIGHLKKLRKLMLAGNQLCHLPSEMSNCTSLELIRLSANSFSALPDWLFSLPNLAWLGLGGNPISSLPNYNHPLLVSSTEVALGNLLGEGASGYVYEGTWSNANKQTEVAVIF